MDWRAWANFAFHLEDAIEPNPVATIVLTKMADSYRTTTTSGILIMTLGCIHRRYGHHSYCEKPEQN
jgi:hypothetical protein